MRELYASAAQLQRLLAKKGIPSAVIGGIAVAVWGNPRVTRDVDLKVMVDRDDAVKLLAILGNDYKVIHDQPELALRRLGYVFVSDSRDTRLDLLLADNSFDRQAITRARQVQVAPRIRLRICTAEDLIIYKLITTRGRDIEDVQNVMARQGNRLDDKYILNWLTQFEQALDDSTLVATYRRMRGKIEPI